MDLTSWQEHGRYFPYRGHSVFYRKKGIGEALLLVHGFPTASWDWYQMWEELCANFEVIAPDMLGFGFSDKPRDYPFSIHDQASLHEQLMAKLDITQCHILAHDYGDTVVQEMLARFLERQRREEKGLEIRSVTLLNGGLFPETHRPRPIQKLLLVPVIGSLLSRMLTKKRFQKSFSAVFGPDTQPSSGEIDDFWDLVARENGHHLAYKLIRYIPERHENRERWVNALIQSPAPIRLINGPADPVSGLHMASRYRELIPDPDIVMLDDAIGHYPQVEDPAGVLEAFLSFVKGIS